jgi:hypothetical protein
MERGEVWKRCRIRGMLFSKIMKLGYGRAEALMIHCLCKRVQERTLAD